MPKYPARAIVPSPEELSTVSIRPGVRILSVLRHLNYRPWFALAEFVDNSVQSFLDCRDEIRHVDGDSAKLGVDIEFDPVGGGRIVVRDNAAGIHWADFPRAFRPAEPPPHATGLSEFGMGMKSAACWFAREWRVRTSALGEDIERTVSFDIDRIVHDSIEELDVRTATAPHASHYTEVTLWNLHSKPYGRTIAKIRDHLASIYRVFVRDGLLTLTFNGEELVYEDPPVLQAVFHRDPDGPEQLWSKEIHFDFGQGLSVHGFAALRRTASVSSAGFALFRRDRLIQGSADETYRPEFVFGKSNSYAYQRLFGELHLEGFEISHTKDGFRWEEHEEPFLELLREHLNSSPLPLLDQAEGYRARPRPQDLTAGAQGAVQRTAEVIEQTAAPVIEKLGSEPPAPEPPEALPAAAETVRRLIDVELHNRAWQIALEATADPAVGDWIELSDSVLAEYPPPERGVRRVGVRMSLAHPFMDAFAGSDRERIEPLLRLAAAIALAETAARDAGVDRAGTIRRNINELLRNSLHRV